MTSAYESSSLDVENVLASNTMVVALKPGETLRSRAEMLFESLDHDAIEEAALYGDDLDEQTDYANDEITRQLREDGHLQEIELEASTKSDGMLNS